MSPDGGNLGIKGNISKINAIPFEAPPLAAAPKGYDPRTQAVGVGYTPEGLDQNSAYLFQGMSTSKHPQIYRRF